MGHSETLQNLVHLQIHNNSISEEGVQAVPLSQEEQVAQGAWQEGHMAGLELWIFYTEEELGKPKSMYTVPCKNNIKIWSFMLMLRGIKLSSLKTTVHLEGENLMVVFSLPSPLLKTALWVRNLSCLMIPSYKFIKIPHKVYTATNSRKSTHVKEQLRLYLRNMIVLRRAEIQKWNCAKIDLKFIQ